MAVDRLEFGKKYYEIGHISKGVTKNYNELKEKYQSLRCVFGVVGVVNADDYDAIIKHKDRDYETFVSYESSDFGLEYSISDFKDSYCLFSTLEEAEERCEFLNTSLTKTFQEM